MLKRIYSILFISLFFIVACQEDNEVDGSLRVAFKDFEGSLATASETADVMVISSRNAEGAIEVRLSVATACGALLDQFDILNSNGEVLSLEENGFTLSIPQGSKSNYFTVRPVDGRFPNGAVELDFFIEEVVNAEINDTHINYNLRVGSGSGFFPENLSMDFEDGSGTPNDFITFNEPGTISNKPIRLQKEIVRGEENQYLSANAFQGNGSVIDTWLISSRRFDFRTANFADFIVDMKYKFEGEGKIEFLWSDNYCGTGNPNGANWNNLTGLESQVPNEVSSNYITLSEEANAVLGKTIHFAIKFSEATAEGSSEYAIDNLIIRSVANGNGDDGDDEDDDNIENSFSTDFEECSDDFAIPQGFNQVHTSDKTDRGWGCRGFGLDNSRAVQASAFSGEAGEVDAWLITFESFDFSSLSSVNLQMQLFSNFSGPGQIELKYSEDYDGSGNPDDATWTLINEVNDLMPDAGSQEWTQVDVNVAELGGKEVYFAFHFYGANDGGSSSWTVDNLAINDSDAFSGDGSDDGGDDDGGDTGELVSIADAKSQIGSNVTISGIVSTPDYGANNGQYYVQDETAGINIIHFSNNGLVEIGDEVELIGTVGEFSNQVQIEVSSVTVISSGNAIPSPISINTSDLSLDSELLGSRVVIENVSLVDASQWPTEAISSSSGVNVEATVNGTTFIIRIDRGESYYDGSSAPNGTFTLTGILGNFNDDVQILPFVEGDVQ